MEHSTAAQVGLHETVCCLHCAHHSLPAARLRAAQIRALRPRGWTHIISAHHQNHSPLRQDPAETPAALVAVNWKVSQWAVEEMDRGGKILTHQAGWESFCRSFAEGKGAKKLKNKTKLISSLSDDGFHLLLLPLLLLFRGDHNGQRLVSWSKGRAEGVGLWSARGVWAKFCRIETIGRRVVLSV